MSVKVLESIKELNNLIKGYFNESTAEPTAEATKEQTFGEALLIDGETRVMWEGELSEGVTVFVVDESGEQLPLPAGTYELSGEMAGTSIVVDEAGGLIEMMTVEVEEEMSEETSEDANALESIISTVESLIKSVKKQNDAFSKELETVTEENNSLKEELKNLTNEFSKLKEEPQVKEIENESFSTKELTNRQKFFMRNMNKNK